jgi:hypothetical protein
MKITEKTFDLVTGETTITERDETPQEVAEREKFEAEAAQHQAEAEAKATQKAALLTKLGITADEAALLLGGN